MEALNNAISIQPVSRSRLVYVRVSSFDQNLAARIANLISETFVTENLNNQLFISRDILSTIQGDARATQRYESLPNVVNNPLIQTLKTDLAKLESQTRSSPKGHRPPSGDDCGPLQRRLPQSPDRGETERIVGSLRAELRTVQGQQRPHY